MTAIERGWRRLLMAGQRPSVLFADRPLPPSGGVDLGLLGDLKRVVDLDPAVTDGAFEVSMAEQGLNDPEFLIRR